MSDNNYFGDNPDPQEILKNIDLIKRKLRSMIEHKEELEFSNVDKDISTLMYQFRYFEMIIEKFYPLEKTFEMLNQSNSNPNSEEITRIQVSEINFCNKKSFVTLTLFSLETLLEVIVKKHEIQFNSNYNITLKYSRVMDFFNIEHEEYENLLNIFHYTRNSLH